MLIHAILGIQGHKISNASNLEVWAGPLADGSVAVVLFNRSPSRAAIGFNFADVGIKSSMALIRDLWSRSNLGYFQNSFLATVDSHDVVMVKVTPTSYVYEMASA